MTISPASDIKTKDLTRIGSKAEPPESKKIYCYYPARYPDGSEGPDHGEYIAHRTYKEPAGYEPRYTRCPKCIEEERQMGIVTRLSAAEIPRRFRGRVLDPTGKPFIVSNDGQRKVKNVADKYIRNFDERRHEGGGLIFAGLPGTGKTHIACFILESVIKQHDCWGRYVTEYQILKKIKATWRRNAEENEEEIIKGFVEPHLLVIDEIGVCPLTPNDAAILHEVFDSRYQEEMRPVIAVGNLTLDEMNEHLGARIMDRLKDGGGVALAFNWKSCRE
jgi:DNA replication protein DnaC